MAKLLDLRTSPMSERIAAVGNSVAAGYEVHLDLSPVVVQKGWLHPRAEQVLWHPEIQETKTSGNRMVDVRYGGWKGTWRQCLLDLMAERVPWLTVRYAF